jgi:hypothetical protein
MSAASIVVNAANSTDVMITTDNMQSSSSPLPSGLIQFFFRNLFRSPPS